jgi:PmbA protein
MSFELQRLMQLVESAQNHGAKATEIYVDEYTGLHAEVSRGRVVKQEDEGTRILIRVFLDGGRQGEVEGDPGSAVALIEQALRAAEAASPDPIGGPVGRLPMVTRGLGIDDRRYPALTVADRVDVIASAERGARGVDRSVQTRGFRYSDRRIRRVFVSNSDVVAEEWSTDFHAAGVVTVGAVTIKEQIESRSFASISSLPFGAVLAKRAVALQGPKIKLDGPTRVMMPPRVTGALFARLAGAFRVDLISSGESLFSVAHAANVPAFDTRVHLIDDAAAPGGTRTYSFDQQGVPPVALALLLEGVPEGEYVDLRTARELDRRPSGHWWDGEIRSSNLMLRSGTRSMSALLSEHSETPTLMLDHVVGLDRLDLATGDFSCTGSGFLRLGNERTEGVVRNARLSGNIIEVLKQVVDIASDTDRVGHVDAPGLLLDGVQVKS